MQKIYDINEFANKCGYFHNYAYDENISVNNGYNCNHPKQEEQHDIGGRKIGCCYSWSCPLGYEADEDDFSGPNIDNNGYDTYEEGQFIIPHQQQYKYIAVDFDGTLCAHIFPEIGEPNPLVIAYINDHAARGTKIILHTCRENDPDGGRKYLDEAVDWCAAHGIHIDAVNENPFVTFGGRKIYADIYIDDRAVNVRDING